jgi:hypothetical protein
MVLKQNFKWFGNTDPFVSPESMGLMVTENRQGFLRNGIFVIHGFGFSDANKTIHASSLRNGVDMHLLNGIGIYTSSLKRTYL